MRKPLFIPLKTQYYEAFADGSKLSEIRLHGPRWNADTCTPGRRVTLSKGYGKKDRLSGSIHAFHKMKGHQFPREQQIDIQAVYGTLEEDMAEICIYDAAPSNKRPSTDGGDNGS